MAPRSLIERCSPKNMWLGWVSLLFWLCAVQSEEVTTYDFPTVYNTTITLNSRLSFSFEVQHETSTLAMKFVHKGSGWASVGFNPVKKMKKCDMLTAEIVYGNEDLRTF